jgi:valyl-tRNA synthetase
MTISELMEIQMEQARLKKDRDRLRAALERIAGEFNDSGFVTLEAISRIQATAQEALQ